jgi:hypothetical protein
MTKGCAWLFVLVATSCGGSPSPRRTTSAQASTAPEWAVDGDRTDSEGSVFACEGDGPSEDAALATAQGICNDKVCKICGVEVESVVQTTETLKGVEMQRKVVERCRRFRKGEPRVLHKSMDCGPNGCVAWLSIGFTKEDEKRECSVYASEHFADPGECQRLLESFRNTPGRDAASFRTRTHLLDDAMAACKDIDVRPTPLVDALHELLFAGMSAFEFTPDAQQQRLEEPFFDTTWYHSRQDMMQDRGAADGYLTTYEPLRQKIRETPTLVGRIALVRDYVADRALVFDVVEATGAKDLDSPAGIARLVTALRTNPVGSRYGSGDVHFDCIFALAGVHTDLAPVNHFFMSTYPSASFQWNASIWFSTLLAKDGKVDESEWSYIFSYHQAHHCPVCVLALLDAPDHGGALVRDARYVAFLRSELDKARNPEDRRRKAAESMPRDPQFMLHARTLLPSELKSALDWDFYLRRLDAALDADDAASARAISPLLAASLLDTPPAAVTTQYCDGLSEHLNVLVKRGASFDPPAEQICACLTGPLAGEGTRNLINKSELYDYALAGALPCVRAK